MNRAFSLPSDAIRAAELLEREELLTEEARYLDGASYRRHCEIEDELAEIHRLLDLLGFKRENLKLRGKRSRRSVGVPLVKQTSVDRFETLLQREKALEAAARRLPPETQQHDELLTELEELRALIKSLKPG